MIITLFKSYPYGDKNRDYTEMSHTKPKQNSTKGIRKTLANKTKTTRGLINRPHLIPRNDL